MKAEETMADKVTELAPCDKKDELSARSGTQRLGELVKESGPVNFFYTSSVRVAFAQYAQGKIDATALAMATLPSDPVARRKLLEADFL